MLTTWFADKRADYHAAQTLQATPAQHGCNQSRAVQSLRLMLRQFGYRLRKADCDEISQDQGSSSARNANNEIN
jgi:hypothetical protein